ARRLVLLDGGRRTGRYFRHGLLLLAKYRPGVGGRDDLGFSNPAEAPPDSAHANRATHHFSQSDWQTRLPRRHPHLPLAHLMLPPCLSDRRTPPPTIVTRSRTAPFIMGSERGFDSSSCG